MFLISSVVESIFFQFNVLFTVLFTQLHDEFFLLQLLDGLDNS